MTQLRGKLIADAEITSSKLADDAIQTNHVADNTKEDLLNYKLVRSYREILGFSMAPTSSSDISASLYDVHPEKKFRGSTSEEGVISGNSDIDECLIRISADHSVIFKETYPVYARTRLVDTVVSGTVLTDNTVNVSGSGTSFLSEVSVNDLLEFSNGDVRKVVFVNSDTELVIDMPTIIPTSGTATHLNLYIDYYYYNSSELVYDFTQWVTIDILVPEMVGTYNADVGFATEFIGWQVFGNTTSTGGGGSLQKTELPVTSNNQTLFPIPYSPDIDNIMVKYFSFHLDYGIDYTISGNTFDYIGTIPTEIGEIFYIYDFSARSEDIETVLDVTANNQTSFSIPFTPDPNKIIVIYNNFHLERGVDFLVSGNILTFISPVSTSIGEKIYIYDFS
jgi:hypothetical protein